MNLKELKEWINNLPEEELGEYNVVYRKIEELDDEYWSAMDISIAATGVDMGNNEIYLCNEQSYQVMKKHT